VLLFIATWQLFVLAFESQPDPNQSQLPLQELDNTIAADLLSQIRTPQSHPSRWKVGSLHFVYALPLGLPSSRDEAHPDTVQSTPDEHPIEPEVRALICASPGDHGIVTPALRWPVSQLERPPIPTSCILAVHDQKAEATPAGNWHWYPWWTS